ncbi:MAG: ligase-associated DNA damage response endonuclease PdeM [Brevirhabdus sp.]
MNDITLNGAVLTLRPSGALFWAARGLLCVSDLHLGKSGRMARRAGAMLPPYEVRDTLARLDEELTATGANTVICLGDSFDDMDAAAELAEQDALWLSRMMAGRRWIWIEGNHDPGPVGLGGSHLAELTLEPLTFRHIAQARGRGEVSGHFHPKLRLRGGGRACFLADDTRLILPAFGTYTGGLFCDDPVLDGLMEDGARAILTGPTPSVLPMPRRARHGATR